MIHEGFFYNKGKLFCEGVALADIATDIGTPVYVYSKASILNRLNRLRASIKIDCSIYFAVKACSNIHILRLLGRSGCGADIVSAGELFRTTFAQIPTDRIVYSGVGKTKHELELALKAKIFLFNIESVAELFQLEAIAKSLGTRCKALLRVNPNIDAKTHPHISTGLKKNKFGLDSLELKQVFEAAPTLNNVQLCGFSCHIGSQIQSAAPFKAAFEYLKKIAKKAPFEVSHLDLGGGLGIAYGKERTLTLEDYGSLVTRAFSKEPYKIGIEPGRALIGPCGVLLSSVLLNKKRGTQRFVVLDAAMNDLARPSLYGATHQALPLTETKGAKKFKQDLVGPVCESADTFQKNAILPELQPGAALAFTQAGAYGMSMASRYNSRTICAEVLVDGTSYAVIRKRETYDDLITHELF